jgi:hypothetical protein
MGFRRFCRADRSYSGHGSFKVRELFQSHKMSSVKTSLWAFAGAPSAMGPDSNLTATSTLYASDALENLPASFPGACHDFMPQFTNLAAPARLLSLPHCKMSARWNTSEDARLLAAVEEHGETNWDLVAQIVGGNRTSSECAHRWHRVLDPKIDKRPWSEAEDQKLLRFVSQTLSEHGDKSWTRIAAEMGSRCDIQCQFRYLYLVRKSQGNAPVIFPASAADPVLPLPTLHD